MAATTCRLGEVVLGILRPYQIHCYRVSHSEQSSFYALTTCALHTSFPLDTSPEEISRLCPCWTVAAPTASAFASEIRYAVQHMVIGVGSGHARAWVLVPPFGHTITRALAGPEPLRPRDATGARRLRGCLVVLGAPSRGRRGLVSSTCIHVACSRLPSETFLMWCFPRPRLLRHRVEASIPSYARRLCFPAAIYSDAARGLPRDPHSATLPPTSLLGGRVSYF